jgi:hypothetical protein
VTRIVIIDDPIHLIRPLSSVDMDARINAWWEILKGTKMQQQTVPAATPNIGGSGFEYDTILINMRLRIAGLGNVPIFMTDATGLFEAYLASFQEDARNWHNCRNCKRFIEAYGDLVTIDHLGRLTPLFWNSGDCGTVDSSYFSGIIAMGKRVARAKITGVFVHEDAKIGVFSNWDEKRGCDWTHFSCERPEGAAFNSPIKTAFQYMAEKGEEFRTVRQALHEWSATTLQAAISLLDGDALYRSEKVLGPVKWLEQLRMETSQIKATADNLIWRAVAEAPAGFCHPRASMAGTLLDDIEKGIRFEVFSKRFAQKMDPLKYQRPQVAPSSGNVARAEKLVEQLGIARSLERRFARLDEIQCIWMPEQEMAPVTGGVFGHLKTKDKEMPPALKVPEQVMTWVKFAAVVLPKAKVIQFQTPSHGSYSALLTAEHMDAPPILQWDSPERRNPFSGYCIANGSPAQRWNLTSGTWFKVTGISLKPSQWQPGFEHQGEGALIILRGAVDSVDGAGNALFPETLKSELHEVRATIEAYSKSVKIGGREQASACGYFIGPGGGLPSGLILRVCDGSWVVSDYRIDRWD